MDLRSYYRNIRNIEASIEDEFPIVKSLNAELGGQTGRLTEVTRLVAARMITDGLAELASAAETRKKRAVVESARKAEEDRRQAARIQFTILSEADLQAVQRSARGSNKD